MSSKDHIVFVVDDDSRMREALHELLTAAELNVATFGSAAEYLAFARPELPACLVLDVHLPDINGLDLQRQIAAEHHPHIVFITGHGDVPSSVRALKAGAVDFLTKPFSESDLLGAIQAALAQDRAALLKKGTLAALQQRFSALTPREREVLPLVVSGLPCINGLELQRLAHAARPELPVILITGREVSEQAMAATHGHQGFFRKPFNGQELLAAVGKALLH